MAETLPKILAISLSAWRNDSNAHTQTDLFQFWSPDRVAQIYTKSLLPDTPVCHEFFQIAENSVNKKCFHPEVRQDEKFRMEKHTAQHRKKPLSRNVKYMRLAIKDVRYF